MRRAARADRVLGTLCRREHKAEEGAGSWRYSTGHCIECTKERKREKYRTDDVYRENSLARRRAHRAKNPDASKEYSREYNRLNAGKRREYSQKIYLENGPRKLTEEQKTRLRAYQAAWRRKQRAEKPELSREKSRRIYRNNSVRIALRNRLARALRAYCSDGKKYKTSQYGIDLQAIIAHLGPCPGDRSQFHIDHIRPLSSFDFDDPEQIKEAFDPKNHQWLPAQENLRKSSKSA
jgi:hypothetical protein